MFGVFKARDKYKLDDARARAAAAAAVLFCFVVTGHVERATIKLFLRDSTEKEREREKERIP